ncbi:MAG: heme d1 biosynthesis radical SAM protein NirJ [Defluviicoccus sp.]|nr:heme d1 biosynthesis radical SAM protein NirJ [Defluviicoccus sp.]MDG4593527.1 heme d1 biosynthesis radical SAM protein NirJ [Defluviicoccus sp.]
MFRISAFMAEILHPTPLKPGRRPSGPVIIWNLIRRCNLKCKHCYSFSADTDFAGELSTEDVFAVMADLRAFGVPVLILSGGEPLLRHDLFAITTRAKSLGFFVALSSNGTLIDPANIEAIAAAGYDYVGISLDGIGAVHDAFRRKEGAFAASLNAVRLCRTNGIKVGLRFTMTFDNAHHLPDLLALADAEGVDKFYLSHLNYAGRGDRNRGADATFAVTRRAMEHLFEAARRSAEKGESKEYVTGNNDADGVFLLQWARRRFPDVADHLRAKLVQWGGNASGVNVANIDNRGDVHPDTFWGHHTLGNVRDRPFSAIWQDTSDPIMAGLKRVPRRIKGRCGTCAHFDICGGNTRIRALRLTGDPWEADPGCYLTDAEIAAGMPPDQETDDPAFV